MLYCNIRLWNRGFRVRRHPKHGCKVVPYGPVGCRSLCERERETGRERERDRERERGERETGRERERERKVDRGEYYDNTRIRGVA